MKNDLNLQAIGTAIARFLQRFHTMLFFLTLGAAVAAALLMVILTLDTTNSSTQGTSGNVVNGSFDEKTIEALREQKQSANQPFSLPSGRTNPFVE